MLNLFLFPDLFGNPLSQEYDYRSYVIHHVPSVELLDRKGNGGTQHCIFYLFCWSDKDWQIWKSCFAICFSVAIILVWLTYLGGGGGGGTHNIFGWGCATRSWKPWPYFRPIYDFPYPISDLTLKMHTLFQTQWCWQIRQLSIDLRHTGLCFVLFVFFFFAINVQGSTCYSKNGPRPNRRNIHSISDQNGKIYTLCQTRNARKWYPLGRHIPVRLIYGVNLSALF